MRTRCLQIGLISLGLLSLSSCGREAPFEFPGKLVVDSTPRGAVVFLDGQDTGLMTPATFDQLEPNEYTVLVSMSGFVSEPVSQTVAVPRAGRADVSFTLVQDIGQIAVTSTPAGARIFVDGNDTGLLTPATVPSLAPGDHVVHVELPGHFSTPVSRTVSVVRAETAAADFQLAEETGHIFVTSNPGGAAIFLDEVDTGQVTPDTLRNLVPDEYLVKIVLAGYLPTPLHHNIQVHPHTTMTAAFTMQQTGSIAVTSSVAGAAVFLDGNATPLVTPATLADLLPGIYTVSVELADHTVDPIGQSVTVTAGQTASADFNLTPIVVTAPKIVLLESMSNVSCPGCPQMASTLHNLETSGGYGLDKVLFIKYSMSWPELLDPHYQANTTANNDRAFFYQDYLSSGIPTLVGDGQLLGSSGIPPTLSELMPLVDAMLTADPGFSIAVSADVTGASIPVTVTLTAIRSVDLSGCAVHAVLVENPIEYEEPPGNQGETVFHWVMRDFETATTLPMSLESGVPVAIDLFLARNPGAIVDHLFVIAFVQHQATKDILQAGTNVPVTAAQARTADQVRDHRQPIPFRPGGHPR